MYRKAFCAFGLALGLSGCGFEADVPMIHGLRPGISMTEARQIVGAAGAYCGPVDGETPYDSICYYPAALGHRWFLVSYKSLSDQTVTGIEYKLNVGYKNSTIDAVNAFYGSTLTGDCNKPAWTNNGDVATMCFHDEDDTAKLYLAAAPSSLVSAK